MDGDAPAPGAMDAGSVVACETGPAEQPATTAADTRSAMARSRVDMWWCLTHGGPPVAVPPYCDIVRTPAHAVANLTDGPGS